MATLDETNIFGLTPNQPEKKDDSLSRLGISESGYLNRLAQIQNMQKVAEGVKEKSEKKYGLGIPLSQRSIERSDLIKQYTSDLAEAAKDPTQEKRDTALESFFETPFMFQMGQYIPDPTGLPTDIAEAEYSGRKFKESREARGKGTEFYPGPLGMSDRPYYPDMTPEEAGLKLQQGLAIGSIPPGIGGIAGIAQSMIGLPSKVLRSKNMDGQGGGSGGISDIPPEPKKDYAGFVSSVEKVALGPQKFGSGQDLINFIESPKRSGISKKELEYIDFDKIRNNPDLTKEDVIKHIQENRPNIYRVERVEDNPTYKGDANENELNALPYNEVRSNEINAEEIRYWTDEHGNELLKQHDSLLNNPVLESNGFVINSDNIKNPTVLADFESFVNSLPEAYSYTDRPLIKINYPDNRTDIEVSASDIDGDDQYSFYQFKDVVEDGATLEFPTLKENPYDIAEEAAIIRVSPDYGGQIDAYESFGDSGTNYQIIGNDENGYQVIIDGESTLDYYNDLADARGRIEGEAFDRGDILESADSFDNPYTDDQLIDIAPMEVITGEATLPTKFNDAYGGDYQLPMGGAENYREFTLHIANPKTATRYSDEYGIKHFGGGDELLHYRTTDRIDEDGKKVLFVEEIQSDLHSTASSTRQSENYEIGPDTKKQATKELKEIFKDNKNLRVADNGDIIKLDADSTYDTTNMLTAEEVSNVNTFENLTNFVSNINLGKMNVLSDAEVKGLKKFREKYGKDEQVLPDFPFKGNDYIELAVKDIMKLASEGDYDRVAFTNPATQLRRNRKDLAYIDSIEINQVPKLTEAEQQFNENWMRNRDRSMVSQMQPESVTGFNRIRLDGGLNNADLNSFVGTHTDFVVNEPQTQKLWQDFHKNQNIELNKQKVNYFDEYMVDNLDDLDNAIKNEVGGTRNKVDYIFARYDSPPTPSQLADDLYQSGIIGAKKKRLKKIEEANDGLIKASVGRPQGALTKDEAYDIQLEADEAISGTVKLPNKPFDEITLDDIFLSDTDLDYINQDVRRGISKIMRRFYDHTLPNVEDAGRYIVKQKGTGFKVDKDKFMLEKGDMDDNLSTLKFESIEDILEGDIVEGDRRFFSLNKTLKEQIKKDAEKNNIPESTKDSQVYQIESEMGEGKKPLDMYARIIPKTAEKFAKKYNKNAEPQLKNVLYSKDDEITSNELLEAFQTQKNIYDTTNENIMKLIKDGEYRPAQDGPYDYISTDLKAHEAATIDITPEMRKAILTEGVNVMYKGGIVNKVKSMDKPIQGNTREM